MKKEKNTIIRVMKTLTWIAFLAYCAGTATMVYAFAKSLIFIHDNAEKNLGTELDLTLLKAYSLKQYIFVVLLLILVSVFKAVLFKLVINILSGINLKDPFTVHMAFLLEKISLSAIAIGVPTALLELYSGFIAGYNDHLFDIPAHYLDGSEDFLFLAGIIFIISIVFKRGIEIQAENDLTV